jgi:hypothetical protein
VGVDWKGQAVINSKYKYNTDKPGEWEEILKGSRTKDGSPQVLPRLTRCGSPEAADAGLIPLADYPDMLINPADYKEVISQCHAQQVFAVYHQKNSGVLDEGWDQKNFGFCWSYGMTMSLMDCRAVEQKPPVRLAPFSLGWLVDWQNRGYYLDATIKGAKDRGIASAEYVPEYNLNPSTFKAGWEEDAYNYRPLEWWDTPYSSDDQMIQYMITILATGRACYVAYNWWGHALEVCGINWNESQSNNIEVVLRNSHAEDDVIILTGSRAIPDELYGVRASSFAG